MDISSGGAAVKSGHDVGWTLNSDCVELEWADGVRPMTNHESSSLLRRMGLKRGKPTTQFLSQLQWAFLKTCNFHNLELLIGTSPCTADACVKAVIEGRGGPCHVLATAFLAFARSLGFEAHLSAGTIKEPGDHLVVIVHIGQQQFVCDVGNGHPYTHPFPLVGSLTIEHHGWKFQSQGDGLRLTLRRFLANGDIKQVYVIDPRPCSFQDFSSVIEAHHEQAGFGPFLTGLRAVLIREDRVVTLRDFRLVRYSIVGTHERSVPDRQAAEEVLRRVFLFTDKVARGALNALGRRVDGWSTHRPAAPRVLVSCSTTGRPANLCTLLQSLATESQRTDKSFLSTLRVLVVENSPSDADRLTNRAIVATANAQTTLDILLDDDGIYGRPIAESRTRQAVAIAEQYIKTEAAFDVVWMIDDDVEFCQLQMIDNRLERTAELRYFEAIDRYYRSHPQVSVLVGGVCGDPPVRPQAILATQLLDIASNLEVMMKLSPDDVYEAPSQQASFAEPDYYYDHSRAGVAHLTTPFLWLGRKEQRTVRNETAGFLQAMSFVGVGKTPTRPLLYTPVSEMEPLEHSLLRGGNTVFLDLDALFAHVYPTFTKGAMTTRRSDMIGASLLDRNEGVWFAGFPCPLLHNRSPLASIVPPTTALLRMTEEFFGVLLCRSVMDTTTSNTLSFDELMALAKVRVERIVSRLHDAQLRAKVALCTLDRATCGWMGEDPVIAAALAELATSVRELQSCLLGGTSQNTQQIWLQSVRGALLDFDLIRQIHVFANDRIEDVVNHHRHVIRTTIENKYDG